MSTATLKSSRISAPVTHSSSRLPKPGVALFYTLAFLGDLAQNQSGVNIHHVHVNAQHLHTTYTHVGRHTAGVVRNWHQQPWGKHKLTGPIIGSLAWANLVFGESIALIGQGLVQKGHASGLTSFLTHMVIALLIEVGFTYPIAASNDRKRRQAGLSLGRHPAEVVQASATAFWLGGAMGVEEKSLGRRYMLIPIGSYLLFAVLLATVGNYHDLAAKVIETPAFFVALIIAGIIKKLNGITGYQGLFERLAIKTVHLVERFTSKR